MASRTKSMDHRVDIDYDATNRKLKCTPELLRKERPDHVRKGDTVTFACDDLDDWAVVFGPESPFDPLVLESGKVETTTVTANRRVDFRRHKYVVVAWANNELVLHDPEVDVDED